MTYRSAIESRARQAADAARIEVLLTELRMLEHELPMARTDRWAGEGEVEDMERAVAWLRRTLKMPVSPEERRERARERARKRRESKRPPQPEPEPIVEEVPNANVCWHWAKPRWGQSCRGNHVDDLLIMFGACRADGERWFWSAEAFEEAAIERHGFELSAVRARIKAHEAVVELAAGRLTVARQSDDQAAWALRRLLGNRPTDRPKPRDPLSRSLRQAMVRRAS